MEVSLKRGSAVLQPLLGRRSPTIDVLLRHRIASELRTLAKERNARAFWIVMHGAMVHVAADLLEDRNLPVHLTVHDDPFGVALMSHRHLPLLPLIVRDFRFAIRRAASVDVISEGMANRYRQTLGVDSIVVHRGMEAPIVDLNSPLDPSVLDIGILGNTYTYSQLALLARATELAAKKIERRARLTIVGEGFGGRLRAENAGRIEVEVTGHLNESDAVARLSRCFALYLNYPFAARAAVFRRTSFPTKLSTYLMTARPLLAHSPSDSSLSYLRSLSGYVEWWNDRNVAAGGEALRRLWDNPLAHGSQHLIAESLRLKYYDYGTNQKRLFDSLDSLVQPRS